MAETATSSDGSAIAFERSGAGPVLVIVGGALNTRRSPGGLVPLLSGRLTVVTFDRRGRGDSTDASTAAGPHGFAVPDARDHRGAIAREVADLHAVVEAVGGSAMLYGHSSGAALALEAASGSSAISRVAGYEPPYSTGGGREGVPDGGADVVQDALADGDRDRAARAFLAGTGMNPDTVADQPWFPGLVSLAPSLPYDFALVDDGPPADVLSRIAVPVLLMAGGDSPAWMHQAAVAAERGIRDVSLRIVPGQSHNVDDAVLAPLLLDFLVGA
ncbi:alpha/beta fold hydrolase [Leifsonia sp. NPDC058248]|uniref:alpha/beta fold hydrolase n=1 Tax=Leifsonia sp. NPDC058248 TaxID=3346402 RepID=UPI0036DB5D86